METGFASVGHLGERMHLLLDRELSPQDEAAAHEHLEGCPTCTAEHAKLAGAVAALGSLGRARAPEGFAARVAKRVRAARRGHGLRPSVDQKVPYEGGIIILLAAAVTALIIGYELKSNSNPVAKNDPVVVKTASP